MLFRENLRECLQIETGKRAREKRKRKAGDVLGFYDLLYKLCKLLSAFGRDIGQNGHRIPLLGGNRRKNPFLGAVCLAGFVRSEIQASGKK